MNSESIALSRRSLMRIGAFSAGTAAVAAAPVDGTISDEGERQQQAFDVRKAAAEYYVNLPLTVHTVNGDETRYANHIASYSKALPHSQLGEVDDAAYQRLHYAMQTGRLADFEAIPMPGPVKLTDPRAGFAFDMEGYDSHQLNLVPPPTLASAEAASEMVELYWQSLALDVPFSAYGSEPITQQAATELTNISNFTGPRENNAVTAKTLFRGSHPGDLVGPYVSQFLLQPVAYGVMKLDQKYPAGRAGENFLTNYAEWLNAQRGGAPIRSITYRQPRYIRSGRDLGAFVWKDFPYQGPLHAGLILLGYGDSALSSTNPYKNSRTIAGFSTFGGPMICDLLARASNCALHAAWFQKWFVHWRLRPEVFGGRIHNVRAGAARYPIHPQVLNSKAVAAVATRYGTSLLPSALPEGSPTHPSYPSGHATFAAAGITMLKALFDENFVIPNPVVPTDDGTALVPYSGPPLTVGNELNKLASNIAIGRNFDGIHYRTDAAGGNALGERVAIGLLRDTDRCMPSDFRGFTFTRFNGTKVTINT